MPDWPVVPLFCFLVVVAFARGGATYALARGARGVAARDDGRRAWLERPAVVRAEGTVRRFGAPAVTLCFLTVGVQTAVNAAAGSLRMPLRRYLPALGVGAALWASVYLTVGLAVLEAFWTAAPGRVLVAAAAVAALVAVVVGVRRSRLGRAGQDAARPAEEPVDAPEPCARR
ncbi:DedA family protein [Nocardioides bruguierae]|uniref:VTT domain-containing protein n=1 Tax=Nocardioides bruguierae TaxID=2945102 RepID=A0A9X2D8V7_9ACTN|nr:VTT domain-containing protein [Nocardioides bruguierae]MCM0621286.1 VTT domain-containing protein [Nocardioides bruguierae]